ncbi:hypothetical protein Hs30E_07520 [Lactococcus hodotermopsidis]|uniref:Uncharacterized protein n=1 Tax=Pseudolactococcus hodotermopsidis TaxID=2709157 RepID=A0A6A0BCN7_9LACT|nr:hypothetical protein [Lactococcus hodotermopsidis]GFH42201.1 hypothetical protein Hs30E_07520 [Lactococcus hodotermopsidis]
MINSCYGVPLERLKIYTTGFEKEFDDLDLAIDFAKLYLSEHDNKLLISEVIYKEFWH